MRFELFGPVSVVVDGTGYSIPRAQTRGVLALLLLNAGRGLSREAVIDAVWGGAAPSTARAQISNAVSDIRQFLAQLGNADAVVTTTFGYRADIDPAAVDALEFERRLQLATKAAADDPEEGARLLRNALDLWVADPLTNVSGAFVEPTRARLLDARLTAVEDLADLELRHGRPELVAAELATLVHVYPVRERLRVRLMMALYRSGRQADALRTARHYRALLDEQEGLRPGPEIIAAEDAIRRAETSEPVATDRPALTPPSAPYRPAQLPAAPPGFVARGAELATLDALCAGERTRPSARRVVAVVGPGGTGKTALAMHWAHRRLADFRDGQLYVDLHGFGIDLEVDAFEALGQLLRGLGQPNDALPRTVDERAAHYRSLMSGRRMLIVLDNAASSKQVRPLLAGVGPHVTLITSRRRLDGLAVTEGLEQLSLGALSAADGALLMRQHVDRHCADDNLVARIVRLSDGLPLALRIVAARLRTAPPNGAAALVADLADEHRRLAALTLPTEDTAVRSAFATSYPALSSAGQRMFRILGLLLSSDTSTAACAAAAGVSLDAAVAALDELRAFHLVQRTSGDRHQTHDLIRLYTRELLERDESAAQRAEAERRLLDWYVGVAFQADGVMRPHRGDLGYVAPPAVGAPEFGETGEVLAWFDLESVNLLRAVELAEQVHPDACWQMAAVLFGWLDRHRRRASWLPVYEAGARAAAAAKNRAAEALMLNSLAIVNCFLKDFDQAAGVFERALVIRREVGTRRQLAAMLANLGNLYVETGHDEAAMRCFAEALIALESEPDSENIQGILFNNIGWAHREAARYDEAIECYSRAGAIARKIEDPQSIAYAEGNMARVHADRGRYDIAVGHWLASVNYAGEAGDMLLEAGAWEGLGMARMKLDEHEAARNDLEHALEGYRAVGHENTATVTAMLASLAAR